MKKIILLLLAIVISAAAFSQKSAIAKGNSINQTILYDYVGHVNTKASCQESNPTNSFENAWRCSDAVVANDVTINANENFSLEQITAEIWTTGAFTSVDVYYYADNAGLPGAQIGSEIGIIPTQTVIGNNGYSLIEAVIDVTPFAFNGQMGVPTTYWIGLQTTGTFDTYWGMTSASTIGNLVVRYNGGWGTYPSDGVYTFSGDCSPINTPPVISCPTDAVADSEPGVCGAVVNFADASAIDLEDGALATTQTMGPASGSVFPIGVTTIEFSATDSAGSTVTCQFTVTVTDVEDPVAMCQDITVELDANGMVTITPADIDGGSTDNCSIASYGIVDTNAAGLTECGNAPELIPNTGTSGPMNPSVAAVGDTGIIGADYTVTNVTLNLEHSWASDLDITLTSPLGTVLELSTDNGGSGGLDTAADLVFTDTSGNDITAWSGGAPAADYQAEGGLFNAVFAGEDINGNWTLDITDDTGGDSGMLNSFCITFTPSGVVSSLTLTCDNVGTNDVILLVTDASGNTDTCTAVVTVEDNQAPVVICVGSGGAVTEGENFEAATIPAGWSTVIESGSWDWTFGSGAMPGTDDFATNAAIFDDDAAGPDVNHARLLSPVLDLSASAAASVSFDYALGDFAGSGKLTVEMWDGAAWVEIFLADDVDIPPTNSGVIDVLGYANAAAQLRFSYDDENGGWNWGAGVDNLVVMYEMPPTPPLEVVLDPTGHATVDLNDLLYSVDDNCGYIVALGDGTASPCEQSNPSNAFENGTSATGSLGRTVANDLVVDPSLDFTLDQITANIFNGPGITVTAVDVKYYEDNSGTPGTQIGSELAVVPTSQTVLGNNFGFDISAVVLDVTPFTFASAGTPTTYWVGLSVFNSDDSNCFWEISTATGNGNDTNYDDGSGVWQVLNPGDDGVYVFSGMCGSATRATVDFDCSNLGENMVDVAVTDAGGNVATCTATVIVLDETAPVITCGPELLLFGANAVSDSPALAIPDANPAGVTTTIEVTDDFTLTDVNVDVNISHTWRGDLDITITSPTGTVVVLKVADIGDSAADVIVTYDDEGTAGVEALSAFDGENSMGTWTLFVADQFGGDTGTINSWGVAYEYSYPNPETELFIELGPDGTVTIEPMDVLNTIEEACAVDVLLLDITEFSCDDIGTPTLVTVFANDTSGNFASCQIEVNIVDRMAPTLTCHGNTTAPFDPATGLYELPDYVATGDTFATDNCTDASMIIFTQTPAPGTQLPATGGTPHIISFTAEDEYGNIATCEFELQVDVVGVQENEILANALALYPNPATNLVTLENSSEISLETALIYDLNGKLVAEFDLQEMQRETTLDISNFSSGVFMVKIIGENASTVKRLIKE